MPNKIRSLPIIRRLLPLLVAILFLPALQTSANSQNENKPFESLQQRLIKDGFNKDMINKIYTSSKTVFETRGVSLFFMHREATLNYGQFSKRRSIKKSITYMRIHMDELLKAEKTYKVDKEIITAIILVETRLGTSLGGRSFLQEFM
jgi:membrane-bound lytic murein transglycosylase B